jgi:YVTN family beta-propeller protein
MSVSPELPIGSELLGYRIEKVVGCGGMGVVYMAEDLRLKRKVALKLLSSRLAEDERFRARLLSESELAASLDHPNIVPIYEAGEADGRIFISMRFVEGEDLRSLLERGPLAPAQALGLVSQIASALDAAHSRGLVHRDVKPSNILIAPEAGHEGADHVYLADFGLTKRIADPDAPAEQAQRAGTVDYMAPEQIRGENVDGRADVYSLGCLLFECLTGGPPFQDRSDVAVLFAHLEAEPPKATGRRPELAHAVDPVIARALAKSPDERYETCRELVEAVRRALGLAQSGRSRWSLAVAAFSVALIGALLLAFVLEQRASGPAALPGADALIRIDPKTDKVAGTFSVGRKSSGVAIADGFVWVTNLADGSISRIDPRTRTVKTILGQGEPTGVAAAGGSAVIADGSAHKVTAFDGGTGALSYPAPLRGPSNGTLQIAGGTSGIWFADPAAGIVGKVDDFLPTGTPSAEVPVPSDGPSFLSTYQSFDGLAVGEGALWVAGDSVGRTVWRIDPSSGRVAATIRLRFVPGKIAAGEGAVWVTAMLDDTVWRIDPTTNRVTVPIRVGRGIDGIAAGEGAVWVASSFDNTVSRIDPRTNTVVARIPVKSAPGQISTGAGGVWVSTTKQPAVAPENAIKIGVLSDCKGTYRSFYNDTLAPAELPLLERGGRRAGSAITDGIEGVSFGDHSVRLSFGCADGTSGSGLAEARRLVEQVGVDILIGPLTGDEGLALQVYARRHPGIAFVNGSSAAQERNPAPNFYSFWYDGAQYMAGVGAYAYHKLGWRTAVTVAMSDAFDWAQAAGFDAEFCSLGGTIVKRIWIPQGTQDFSGLVAQLPQSGVDGLLVEAQGEGALQALATGYAGLRGNISRKVVIGTTVIPPRKLGDRVRGIVWAGPKPNAPKTYLASLRRAFPEIRKDGLGSVFDYPYYDAMSATLQALDRVHGDLSRGERAFMAALGKVVLDAPNGRTALGPDHQAIAPTTLMQTLAPPSRARAIGTIARIDHTFGGYFTPNDAPPSKTSPVCKHGNPPPWAR